MSEENSEILMFDWLTYYNIYKEIIISDLGIDTKSKDIANYHWKYYGKKNDLQYFQYCPSINNMNSDDENPEYILFNVEQYLSLYPDLKTELKTKNEGWQHWINYGKKEGRQWCSIEEEVKEEEEEKEEEKKEEEEENESIYKENWATEEHKILEDTDINKEFKLFDWVTYINNYSDLSHFSNKMEAWKHWTKNGKNENRSYLKLEPEDDEYIHFDWEKYLNKYIDLTNLKTKEDAWKHWITHGKIESRSYFSTKKNNETPKEQPTHILPLSHVVPLQHYLSYEDNFYQEYTNFDWVTYISNYDDIGEIKNKEDAFEHWFFQGKAEGRTCIDIVEIGKKNDKIMKIETEILSHKISNENVTNVNSNKEGKEGKEEESEEKKESEEKEDEKKKKEEATTMKKDIAYHKNIMKKTLELKRLYESEMDQFMNDYKIANKSSIYADPQIEFRYYCYKYLDYIKYYTLPEIELNRSKNAVLVEFREFAHVEFLIRNAIMQLGSTWSFTVICGDSNYDFMTSICKNISKNIKIVKIDEDDESSEDYNKLLKSKKFWNHYLKGSKILLYQEDSFIFSNNIDDFMEYDYIGAPRYANDLSLPINVGNRDLSLRTRRVMIDVIDALKEEKLDMCDDDSEDVYFSKHIQRLELGNVADREIASQFSSELIYNKDSFAGHQFWLSDPCWKDRMYNCLFKIMNETKTLV